MKGIDKSEVAEKAISRIQDGASIMIGGFGVPGTPFYLIDELVRQGRKRLTLIKNDANETGMGVDHLLDGKQVSKLITSHIGLNPRAIEMMNEGWFHPTLNLENIDPACSELGYIVGNGKALEIECFMSNNFAFGGINTSLIFRREA